LPSALQAASRPAMSPKAATDVAVAASPPAAAAEPAAEAAADAAAVGAAALELLSAGADGLPHAVATSITAPAPETAAIHRVIRITCLQVGVLTVLFAIATNRPARPVHIRAGHVLPP
jgi:hypothetical protein